MKSLTITKIEVDNDTAAVTFRMARGQYAEDYDLNQLGEEIEFISSIQDMVMVNGKVTLKVGDSITDEIGGQPILGAVRTEARKINMSIVKPSDYRDAFAQKMSGAGEE